MTTELLGFENLTYNSIYAQKGRGKTELFLATGMAAIASTLSSFAADICLYNAQNFDFLRLPDEFTTGSSIMPHKKNPDVFELIRGHCNILATLPAQVSSLTGNLTTGYHRDYQLLKTLLFPAIQQLKECLEVSVLAVQRLTVHEDILNDPKYDLLFTVEAVNEEVLSGIPFRDAYKKIAERVEKGTFKHTKKIKHTHEGSIGNLCNDLIMSKMKAILKQFKGLSNK